jgi:iron complex outermembrane receptor protein
MGGNTSCRPTTVATGPGYRVLLACALTFAAAHALPPRIARADQAPSAGGVEEIVVSARRVEERLQDIPISVSAVTSAELERRGVSDLKDLQGIAPNVDVAFSPSGAGGGSNSQITIRGVGQTDFLITTDPGVGVYVDGVYFARSTGGVLDLVDPARIEILRGPQGTLFGRNTIGGAIHLVSAPPADELGGYAELLFGSFDRVNVKAALDVPLVPERLTTKLAVLARRADGYADRIVTGEELGDEDSLSARMTTRWVSEPIELLLSVDYTRRDQNSAASAALNDFAATPLINTYNAVVPPFRGTPAFSNPATGDWLTTRATGPNLNDAELWGVGANLAWRFGALELRSITAYREQEVSFGRDGDNSPLQVRETLNRGDQSQLSQELQLVGSAVAGRLDFLLGAYYFTENAVDTNQVRLVTGLFPALEARSAQLNGAPCTAPFVAPGCRGNPRNVPLDLDFDIYNEIDVRSFAPFAHASFRLDDRWSLSAGARYTRETKQYALVQRRINSGVFIANIAPASPLEEDYSAFSPKLGLEFRPRDGVLTYVSVARGFRSGGFNGRPTGTQAEVTAYKPEHLTAYEIGVKSEWLDRRLVANLAAFRSDYEDIQLTAVVASATGGLVVTVDNAGEGRMQGGELELRLRPLESLQLQASLGLIDAEYTDVGTATVVNRRSQFVKTPERTAGLLVRQELAVGTAGRVSIQGDWSFRSRVFNDVQNTPALAQGDLHLYGARIGYVPASESWELAVFGRNLSDERFIVNGVSGGAFGVSEAVIGAPREYGASFRLRF